MGFQTPQLLLLLLLLPLLVWVYQSRYGRGVASAYVLYPNLASLAQVREPSWRRHLGAWLYLLALGLGIVALAKPQATVLIPDNLAGVMVAIDVSGSMRVSDIEPSRIEAAKKAAQSFVQALPQGVKVGLVSFGTHATLESPLVADHQKVIERIGLLQLDHRTAIGDGIMESLKAFAVDGNHKPLGPATIVLLSDGRSNRGIDPLEAAKTAQKMGVKVHTIGLGKPLAAGEVPSYLAFDEEALRAIANITGGQYYPAESAAALQTAYHKLNQVVAWKPTYTEVSGLWGLLAGLVLASSLTISNLRRRVL